MKIRLSALLAIAFIIGFSACKKPYNDAPTVVPQVGLNVINASADAFNIYLNGSRLNSTSTILPGYSSGYYHVEKGQQSFQIKKPFNTATNTIQTLFSITVPADSNLNHTLFVTDETANDAFVTVDNFTAIPGSGTDTCYIRFVNSSPGSGALDVTYGGAKLFSNLSFKGYSDFSLVNTVNGASVTGVIPLEIFSAGSSTPLFIDSVALNQGNHYTFYTLGKPGTTGFTIAYRRD
jgi:hypothetical protein